jgi:uncharacterized protein (TIGR02145 family)
MKHFFTLISLLGIIFSFQPKPCHAQKEFSNWYFGAMAGMSFNTGSPVVFLTNTMNSWTNGSSNISDSLGNILFYTNGWEVRNRNNAIMPNGWINGASPTSDYDKINIAFQQLSDHSKYYIFCSGLPTGSGDAGLRYSVVDMNLDGGLGDIPAGQNGVAVPAANNAFVAVSATRHHNNRDVWVVARLRDTDSNYYASYLVNAAGINFTPVFSNSHIQLFTYPATSTSVTSIKISRDGTKLAAVYDTLVEYCRFNSSNGEVTPLALTVLPKCSNHLLNNNTAEFSLDSKYLYVSAKGGMACNTRYFIYQFDASLTDSAQFVNSATLITNENRQHGLQLAPDNKIYCSINYETGSTIQIDSLSVINNPSSTGIACNYQQNVLYLKGRGSGFALPDYVERYYALIYDNDPCLTQLVNFTSAIWPPADTIRWEFGDPQSASDFSTLPNPSHFFTGTGSYTVELYVRHNDNRTDTTRMVINILLKPNIGQDRTICNGDSATFDAGACPGGSYLWKNLGTGATVGTSRTFKAGLAGTYAVYVTNPNNCIGADTVQLVTIPAPAVANNPPLVKTICSGEPTNIPLTSSPPGATFHWTATLSLGNVSGFSADSGLVINQVLVNSLSTPGIVIYHITPKIGDCAGSSVDFQVTVNPGDSVKVSITASNNNICSGTSVTYLAFPTNEGSLPSYQWKVNGVSTGSNSSAFTYTPVNNDVVKCILTSSNTICVFNNPATSNSITMMVIPIHPVSVSILPSLNPVCEGNSVTFSAYPVNGGSPPSYQWKVNGVNVGVDNVSYSYTPVNGDIVTCVLNSNVSCASGNPATSNNISMTVNPDLGVIVTVAPSQNPFCAGGSVTFTATPTNGGVPQYQWKVNGANVGTNSNTYAYNPLNGDQVSCIMNSSIPCPLNNPATSNTVTMTQNTNLPAGVSITATPNPFCPGTTVNYNAVPINGGLAPIYQWKVNGMNQGTNSQTFSYAPQAGDSIRCVITSNLPCVTNNPASSGKIIMSSLPAPLVSFPFCFDSITTITAAPFVLKGAIPIGGIYSGPGVNSFTGVFSPSLAGTGIKTITYSYTNVSSCTSIMTRNIIVLASPVFTCGNTLTDIRDNKVYPTIQIGTQCWMQKNLNYGTTLQGTTGQTDNCVNEKYCYSNDPANCTLYGGLYQWDEVMAYSNIPGAQGLCPPGWHIPTQAEWITLFNASLTQGLAGKPLQDSVFNGFKAKESGADYSNITWKFQGFATIFWSSNSFGAIKALSHGMNLLNFGVSDYYSNRSNAFAMRCLKD